MVSAWSLLKVAIRNKSQVLGPDVLMESMYSAPLKTATYKTQTPTPLNPSRILQRHPCQGKPEH